MKGRVSWTTDVLYSVCVININWTLVLAKQQCSNEEGLFISPSFSFLNKSCSFLSEFAQWSLIFAMREKPLTTSSFKAIMQRLSANSPLENILQRVMREQFESKFSNLYVGKHLVTVEELNKSNPECASFVSVTKFWTFSLANMCAMLFAKLITLNVDSYFYYDWFSSENCDLWRWYSC